VWYLLFVYTIPVIGIALSPLNRSIQGSFIHFFFGRVEWLFTFLRDLLLVPILLIIMTLKLVKGEGFFYIPLVFLALSLVVYYFRRLRIKAFIKFVQTSKLIKPEKFFNLYYSTVSLLPCKFESKSNDQLKAPIDYSKKSKKLSFFLTVPGIFNTATVSRLVIKASSIFAGESLIFLANKLAAIWGARVLQITESGLQVKGVTSLQSVEGRSIFVSNHKSYVDFAVMPLVVELVNEKLDKKFIPRYMAARDHFCDNPILYRVVGMGRALEAIGTVFVDRRSKKGDPKDSVTDAAKSIVDKNVDIVIYPQGTRAYSNKDMNGKRVDAGYYTTGKIDKVADAHGHLKKGAAHLSIDVAYELAKRGTHLNIIPIGLKGTDILAPRGKILVGKGTNIEVTIGEPLLLTEDRVECLMSLGEEEFKRKRKELVKDLHVNIDQMLKQVTNINAELMKRLFLDIRRSMSENEVDRFLQVLEAWRGDEDLIFSIIDCIYALPAGLWATKLKQLYLVLNETDTPREKVIEFKRNLLMELS